jgi:RNA polymerase sigma-70 factor, ECF subfamily
VEERAAPTPPSTRAPLAGGLRTHDEPTRATFLHSRPLRWFAYAVGMSPDEQVAALLGQGEVDAAATLALQTFGPALLGYLASLLDEDDARDVFSLLAEDAWCGLPGFRFECSLRAWLFRLAWHAANRFLRDPWRRRVEPLPSSAASRLAASVVAGASQLPGGRRDTLRALRRRLPPEDQTLLVLRVDKELEWNEVASVLAEAGEAVEPAALRKRFERLKDRLAALAREEGLLE